MTCGRFFLSVGPGGRDDMWQVWPLGGVFSVGLQWAQWVCSGLNGSAVGSSGLNWSEVVASGRGRRIGRSLKWSEVG